MIDITMTAIVLRSEILRETLISLVKNLKYSNPLRLIIDVAPAANSSFTQHDLYKVASTYFDNAHLICRMVEESKQAEAIKWMWSKSESDFVLHWEDDWVLTRGLDLDKIENLFFKHYTLGMLYFDRCQKSVLDYPGYKGVFAQSEMAPSIYIRLKGKSLGGPPALLRKSYKEAVLPLMKDNECLDITSRTKGAKKLLEEWETCVYVGESGKGRLVKDIGTAWRESKGLKMKKNTPRGVTWVRK